MKTQHRRTLKYDWGYGCDICSTWQHQSLLIEIQHSYAAKEILDGLNSDEINWCDGTLQEFIEAAQALDLDYDYCKTNDGWDFTTWNPENDEKVARIRL